MKCIYTITVGAYNKFSDNDKFYEYNFAGVTRSEAIRLAEQKAARLDFENTYVADVRGGFYEA